MGANCLFVGRLLLLIVSGTLLLSGQETSQDETAFSIGESPTEVTIPGKTGRSDPMESLTKDRRFFQKNESFKPVELPCSSHGFRSAQSGEKDHCGVEPDEPTPSRKPRFRLKEAVSQSMLMLAVQHGFRLLQKKTTAELDGPFFRDWDRSVNGLKGWGDTDSPFTNYVAHPLQGATTSRIFLTNSPGANQIPFGKSKRYWTTRLQSMAWSAAWSTQFELGPISEATIGNVGMRMKYGRTTMGWVDLVMTPTAGTVIVVGEDALERYFIQKMLRRNKGKASTKTKIFRSLLTPTYSVNNLLRGKVPWSRD